MKDSFQTAVILAGGKSSRMGFDKQFLTFNHTRIFDRNLACLKEEFEEIIVVTQKPTAYESYPVICVDDIEKNAGPLGGLHAGLMKSTSDMIFLIACDMPLVQLNYIRYMKAILKREICEICATKTKKGIEPFHGFYSKKLREKIEIAIAQGNRSLRVFTKSSNTYWIEEAVAKQMSPDLSMFYNVNTLEELRRIEQEIW